MVIINHLLKIFVRRNINKIKVIKQDYKIDKIHKSKFMMVCGIRQSISWFTVEYKIYEIRRQYHPGDIISNNIQYELKVFFFNDGKLIGNIFIFPSLEELPFLYLQYNLNGKIISQNYQITH